MSSKISSLDAILAAALADADLFTVVDVSDTSMAGTGTNKKIVKSELKKIITAEENEFTEENTFVKRTLFDSDNNGTILEIDGGYITGNSFVDIANGQAHLILDNDAGVAITTGELYPPADDPTNGTPFSVTTGNAVDGDLNPGDATGGDFNIYLGAGCGSGVLVSRHGWFQTWCPVATEAWGYGLGGAHWVLRNNNGDAIGAIGQGFYGQTLTIAALQGYSTLLLDTAYNTAINFSGQVETLGFIDNVSLRVRDTAKIGWISNSFLSSPADGVIRANSNDGTDGCQFELFASAALITPGTDCAGARSEIVAGKAEYIVFDEDGNEQQLTSHRGDGPDWLYDPVKDTGFIDEIKYERQRFAGKHRYTNLSRRGRLQRAGVSETTERELATTCEFVETLEEYGERVPEMAHIQKLDWWEEQDKKQAREDAARTRELENVATAERLHAEALAAAEAENEAALTKHAAAVAKYEREAGEHPAKSLEWAAAKPKAREQATPEDVLAAETAIESWRAAKPKPPKDPGEAPKPKTMPEPPPAKVVREAKDIRKAPAGWMVELGIADAARPKRGP